MADRVIICISEISDIDELAPNLRDADLEELKVLNIEPKRALLRGYIFSDECFTLKFKGKAIGMFGYSGFCMPENMASVWFLGADEMIRHPFVFVRDGKKYIDYFLKRYSVLANAVYKKNTVHIEWLKRMGMTMSDSIYINGEEFIKFYKESYTHQHTDRR